VTERAPVILASGSRTRADMLRNAGLEIEIVRPNVDEEMVKAGLRHEGLTPREQADALAEAKAVSVSRRRPGLVIGADQMLSCEGATFDKPPTLEAARAQLEALSGKQHILHTAAVVARDGAPIWRFVAEPKLRMRALSPDFLAGYLDAVGEAALESVGAYQLEGRGAQLFADVSGDYFSILGLPLLPLLAFLREHGAAPR
jgi:septum formation protein